MHNNKCVEINLSSTFYVKSKCKHCKSSPELYFLTMSEKHLTDHRKFLDQFLLEKKKIVEFCPNNYISYDPSNFNSLSNFNYKIKYNKMDVRNHKNSGSTNFNEYLFCRCRKTIWRFNDGKLINQHEIKERKSKILLKI